MSRRAAAASPRGPKVHAWTCINYVRRVSAPPDVEIRKVCATFGLRYVKGSTLKQVLADIATYADPDGTNAWASVPRVASDCELDERTARAAIRLLEHLGMLRTVEGNPRDGRTNRYRVVMNRRLRVVPRHEPQEPVERGIPDEDTAAAAAPAAGLSAASPADAGEPVDGAIAEPAGAPVVPLTSRPQAGGTAPPNLPSTKRSSKGFLLEPLTDPPSGHEPTGAPSARSSPRPARRPGCAAHERWDPGCAACGPAQAPSPARPMAAAAPAVDWGAGFEAYRAARAARGTPAGERGGGRAGSRRRPGRDGPSRGHDAAGPTSGGQDR